MPEAPRKHVSVYSNPEFYSALRLKAAESDCGVSDLVNDAVRQALEDGDDDLAAFESREHEADYPFEDVVNELNRRGEL